MSIKAADNDAFHPSIIINTQNCIFNDVMMSCVQQKILDIKSDVLMFAREENFWLVLNLYRFLNHVLLKY